MMRETQNNAHGDHSGMCRNGDIGIDCSELQQKSSQLDLKRGEHMSRHFGLSSYHPNEHYMRGPGLACAQNARNILKSNARPASPFHAPGGGAGPLPFNDAEVTSIVQRGERLLPESRPAVSASGGESHGIQVRSRSTSHALFLDQSLQNLRTTAFSFLTLGLIALPFFLGAVVYALFFAPSVAAVF